jgi:hypothetical protein
MGDWNPTYATTIPFNLLRIPTLRLPNFDDILDKSSIFRHNSFTVYMGCSTITDEINKNRSREYSNSKYITSMDSDKCYNAAMAELRHLTILSICSQISRINLMKGSRPRIVPAYCL